MMRGRYVSKEETNMKTTFTFIEKVAKLMKDIRIAEGFFGAEDWWLRTAQNMFEFVNLYKVNGSSYDEFVLSTTMGAVAIPIDIPCRDCHIINIYDNPRYSKIYRVPIEEGETVVDYFYDRAIEVESVLGCVNFIDAVKWLVQWDEEGRKNCPYDLW